MSNMKVSTKWKHLSQEIKVLKMKVWIASLSSPLNPPLYTCKCVFARRWPLGKLMALNHFRNLNFSPFTGKTSNLVFIRTLPRSKRRALLNYKPNSTRFTFGTEEINQFERINQYAIMLKMWYMLYLSLKHIYVPYSGSQSEHRISLLLSTRRAALM